MFLEHFAINCDVKIERNVFFVGLWRWKRVKLSSVSILCDEKPTSNDCVELHVGLRTPLNSFELFQWFRRNSLLFALWPMPNCRSNNAKETVPMRKGKQHAVFCGDCICIQRCIKLSVENRVKWIYNRYKAAGKIMQRVFD